MADNTTPISSVESELHIVAASALPATYDQTGYEALTYVEVEEISNLGEFNIDSASVITHTPLKTGILDKRKGTRDYGTMNITMAIARGNTGQGHVITAAAASGPSTFKVVDNNNNTYYFTALVTQVSNNIGSADQINLSTVVLNVNVKPVYVAAP